MEWLPGVGILGAAAILAAVSVAVAVSMMPPKLDMEAVHQAVRDRVDDGLTPGMIIATVDASGIKYFAHGVAERDGDPIDPHTVLEIGSITKAFVGVLLAQLADDGVVALDDPAADHLPEGTHMPEHEGVPVTLAHLATHTSGLPRLPVNFDPADMGNPYAGYTLDAMREGLSRTELSAAPGARYEYSNLGLGLLGAALAHAAGSDLESLLHERIFEPLGMHDTAFTLNDGMRARLAPGHADGEAVSNWDFNEAMAGAGAVRSTARDMAKFLEACLAGGGHPLRAAIDASTAPRADTDIPDTRVGLGWHISRTPSGKTAVWHNGGTGGYRAIAGYDRKAAKGVVVLSNSAAQVTDDIGLHLIDPAAPLADLRARNAIAVDAAVLEAYAGAYEVQPGVVLDIELRGDTLHARLTGQDWLPIVPEAEDAFFYTAVDAQIVFERDAEGTVTGLVLHQGGVATPATKSSAL